MSIMEAIQIIESLVKGYSPFTGKEFSKKNVLRKQKTIQALEIATKHLSGVNDFQKTKQSDINTPRRHNYPWKQPEIDELKLEYERSMPLNEIAMVHERKISAIRCRLIDIGCLIEKHPFK